MSEPPSTPFALETDFPPVIFSYCTKTDGGRGEERMWQVANHLRSHGIASFNGKQVEPGEDWMQKWLGKMPEADVCIALLSPDYFKSGPCKKEIFCAARQGKHIIPVIFETPPPMKKGYFGKSVDEREKGNFVLQELGNWLPPPEEGLFQDNFERNLAKCIEQVRKHVGDNREGSGGGGGGGTTTAAESRQHSNARRKQAASGPSYGGTTDRQEVDSLKSLFGRPQRDDRAGGSSSVAKASDSEAVSSAEVDAFMRKVNCSLVDVPMESVLNWGGKMIDGSDCKVIAHLAASGALPKLESLKLALNSIGDVGIAALATALGSGALASLKEIMVDSKHMRHPQLVAACQPRGIRIT